MIKLKKGVFMLLVLVATSMFFTSCLTTKTSVGTYTETRGQEYVYARGKQLWLFWGLVPVGRTNVNTPANGNCEVVTRFKFGDVLIGGLTGGILTSYSITVKAKKN